jgi:glycosyltransferase involved in cell wall biosynthesis
MSYNLSGCVFIKDTFKGAFCLFESMYQLLPLCDEFIVMDLGSTDGTLEALKEIEAHNPKVRIVHSNFYEQDAAIFAYLANDLIAMCNQPNVLYYQADEIWHEDLIKLTRKKLDYQTQHLQCEELNYSFWRVQLKYNFQRIKWFPHPVHRIGPKDSFEFENDGMNTGRTFEAEMISNWGIEHFMQWSDRYKRNPVALPTNEMILDVSLTGGFIDNIPNRRRMHLPYWNEPDVMPADEEGMSVDDWYNSQKDNQEWDLHSTKFNIPEIMRFHLGRRKYMLRDQLLEMLKVGEGWR